MDGGATFGCALLFAEAEGWSRPEIQPELCCPSHLGASWEEATSFKALHSRLIRT